MKSERKRLYVTENSVDYLKYTSNRTPYYFGSSGEVIVGLFSRLTSNMTRRNGLQLCQGIFSFDLMRYFKREIGQAPEQAAQGGNMVTIPGSIQEMFRCCTERHDLAKNTGDSWIVGPDDLRGLCQPCRFYDSIMFFP